MEKIEYKGHLIEIDQDEFPEDPRTWDNLGTMVIFSNRYNLGDIYRENKQIRGAGKKDLWFTDREDFDLWLKENYKKLAIIIPLHVADYGYCLKIISKQVVNNTHTFPLSDLLNASGYLLLTKETIASEYGTGRYFAKALGIAEKCLLGEIDEYNKYLSGDVWGFKITRKGEEIDSCWGFYGHDYCIEEAKSIVDHEAAAIEEEAWGHLEPVCE